MFLFLLPSESLALDIGAGASVGGGSVGGGSVGADVSIGGGDVNADVSASVGVDDSGGVGASADVSVGGSPGTGIGTGGTAIGAAIGARAKGAVIGIDLVGAMVVSSDNRAIGYVQSAEVQQGGSILVRVALLERLNARKPYARILLRQMPRQSDVVRIGMSLDRLLQMI